MKTLKITCKEIIKNLPKRKKNSHKKHYGRVLIVAGSNGMAGAAVLSALSALKAGAGLVTLAIVKSQQAAIVKALPEVMTLSLDESLKGTVKVKSADKILRWQKKNNADVMLLGPGLDFNKDTMAFVKKIISKIQIPLVLDADGLNAVAQIPNYHKLFSNKIPYIITPHAGEAARLAKGASARTMQSKILQIKKIQSKIKGVTVFKGSGTVIAGENKIYLNTTGNPGLAKGGSGDILAGLITGFWAQTGKKDGFSKKTALSCALTAVYLHGLSADLAVKDLTQRCVLAGELLNYLPKAIMKIKK